MTRSAPPSASESAEKKTSLAARLRAAMARKRYPASYAQQRLWVLQQLAPTSAAYHMPMRLEGVGELDLDALERALAAVVARHEVLRTRLFEDADGLWQEVVPPSDFTLRRYRMPRAEALAHSKQWIQKPFDLDRGELLRAAVYEHAPQTYLVAFCLHHIAGDGVSVGILVRELAALYAGETLPRLPLQYGDYTVWQRRWLAHKGVLDRQLAYWMEQLRAATPLQWPVDYPRPPVAPDDGTTVRFELPTELVKSVAELARKEGTTPYVVWLALYGALLGVRGGQQDVSIGSPIANRRETNLEPLIGYFVNTVVQRLDLTGRPSMRELVRRAHAVSVGAQEHQDAPFEKVVQALDTPRDLSTTPLFQALLSYQVDQLLTVHLGDVELRALAGEPLAKFDLSLTIIDAPENPRGELSYRSALYDERSMARVPSQLISLARTALEFPDTPIDSLSWRDEAPASALEAAAATVLETTEATLVNLFDRSAKRAPEALAVRTSTTSVTYDELNRRAGRIARAIAAHSLRAESPVGVLMEQGPTLLATMLGVLRAGCVYLPLDPSYPADRLRFMLEDSSASLVLASPDTLGHPIDATHPLTLVQPWVDNPGFDEGPLPVVHSAQLAYLIYTSGSTGRPKAVAVEHAAAAAFARSIQSAIPVSADDVILQFASPSFDASIEEIFLAFATGACLAPRPSTKVSPSTLREWCEAQRVSVLDLPTAFWHEWCAQVEQHPFPATVHTVVIGGEQARSEAFRQFIDAHPGIAVVNTYGPTETIVTAVTSALDVAAGRRARPPIGRPLPAMNGYVLSSALRPVPSGAVGELYLSSSLQQARGYLHRPGITAEKFVPDPFTGGGRRMYRTGDLVRRLESGELEFLGRADFQVKVRGYRIELGEIESQLEAQPSVQQAVVVARDERLHAYVVTADGATDASALRTALSRVLPEYMVPATYTALESLPLTPSGKLDRRALPEPEVEKAVYEPPRGEVEQTLATVWQELLDVERVGRGDDFFALGGHSLLATRLVARVSSELGQSLSLRDVFERPQLGAMAEAIGGDAATPPLTKVEREGPLPASYAQERQWVLHQLSPESAAYHMPVLLEVTGSLDDAALERALKTLTERHEILRTRLYEVGGELRQEVLPEAPLRLERFVMAQDAAHAHAAAWMRRPFALFEGEMLRSALYELTDSKSQLLAFCMHHIASDGVSMQVLVREVGALLSGEPLEPLPVQYGDYAAWQRQWMEEGGELERQLGYWTTQLRGVEPLQLPTDFPRPKRASDEAGAVPVHIPAELSQRVHTFARQENTTPYVVWLSLYGALLGRLGRQDDLTLGSPVANRRDPKLEGLIGFFVNTVVQRLDLSGRPSLRELVRRTHETALRTQEHQDAPFEQVVQALGVPRDLSSTPLFQAMLAYQSAQGGERLDLGEVSLEALSSEPSAQFDLNLSLSESPNATTGALVYRSTLFSQQTMERLVAHLVRLSREALASPSAPLSTLSLLDGDERTRVLERFQGEAVTTDAPDVLTAFRAQAKQHPDAEALRFEGTSLTYAELDRRTDALAAALHARGIGPGRRVGLKLERSLGLVEAVWGVWKAGAAYVPLDPSLPAERLAFMMEDAAPQLVLTDEVDHSDASFSFTQLMEEALASDASDASGRVGRVGARGIACTDHAGVPHLHLRLDREAQRSGS